MKVKQQPDDFQVEELTDVVPQPQGAFALYRMEKRGWIEADWGTSDLGRRARFYRLTPKGRKQLKAEAAEWTAFAAAVTRVMQTA